MSRALTGCLLGCLGWLILATACSSGDSSKRTLIQNKGSDTMVNIAQSDVVRGLVQIVKPGGGDNNLHLHTGMDSVWFVLKGRVRFYGPEDVVIGEYGPHEGILMPRNNPYWFAAVGDVDLELLQVIGMHPDVKNERVDLEERKWQVNTTEHLDGRILEDV